MSYYLLLCLIPLCHGAETKAIGTIQQSSDDFWHVEVKAAEQSVRILKARIANNLIWERVTSGLPKGPTQWSARVVNNHLYFQDRRHIAASVTLTVKVGDHNEHLTLLYGYTSQRGSESPTLLSLENVPASIGLLMVIPSIFVVLLILYYSRGARGRFCTDEVTGKPSKPFSKQFYRNLAIKGGWLYPGKKNQTIV